MLLSLTAFKKPLIIFMAENNSENVDVDTPTTHAHMERLLAYR